MNDQLKINVGNPVWPPTGGAGVCRLDNTETLSNVASQQDPAAIKSAIRRKYAEVAVSAAGKFQYPTGREGAELLGYDRALIQSAPAQLLRSFCGVGNPFSPGEIRRGSVMLDVGCGAGFDMYVASRLVGYQGKVCGIDLTDDMASLARKNLEKAGASNVEVKTVDTEHIPYPDHFFDVVISNGVINLSPSKQTMFREIYRVLNPGGALQFADVVLEKDLPASLAGSAEAWSQWIGGAIPVRDQTRLLEEAGFKKVEWLGMTGFRTSAYTVGALFKAHKPNA